MRLRSVFLQLLAVALVGALATGHASAQAVQVKPWFLLIVDTSGSMDGSDVGTNSCGYTSNRMGAARCAIRNILDSTGDAEFGLMQFLHRCENSCGDLGGGDQNNECEPDRQRLERINSDNGVIREWVDDQCQNSNMCTNPGASGGPYTVRPTELYAVGYTPLGESLLAAGEYFRGDLDTAPYNHPAPSANDAFAGCRPINVILLTDGAETCGGNARTAATALRSTSVPRPVGGNVTMDINTYVIAFGYDYSDGGTEVGLMEDIANNGGTDADQPGAPYAFYASDEETLSAALTKIVIDAQLREVCNGGDDDCDNRVDEDNPRFCDIRGSRPDNGIQTNLGSYPCPGGNCTPILGEQDNVNCAQREWAVSSLCTSPQRNLLCVEPEEYCDQADDDCDGIHDEDAPPLIGVNDGCDGVDNDCDGMIDENCSGCVPSPETCDNVDNDCNGTVDDLTRPCSINLGQCTQGVETCSAGVWQNDCSGVTPDVESCDNVDNNCDGVIDQIFEACWSGNLMNQSVGICQDGIRSCVAGNWGNCLGEILPTPELCDGIDNDCDADPNDDGADEPLVGQDCGPGLGVCMAGTNICQGGTVSCQGGNVDMMGQEICDGLDNDCDGRVDENPGNEPLPDVGVECFDDLLGPGLSVVGECGLGTSVCVAGQIVCPDYTGPTPELCDDLDHDCDGNLINGVDQTDALVDVECGTNQGICMKGLTECVGPPYSVECNAPNQGMNEVCNGDDDDCDGRFDEGVPTGASCDGGIDPALFGIGACQAGLTRCVGGSNRCDGAIGPSPEVCDGDDNDCDGIVDESTQQDPIPGVGDICGGDLGICNYGQYSCVGGQLTCDADPIPGQNVETCNGDDDDCDGRIDENNPGDGMGINGGDSCDGGVDLGMCLTSADPSDGNLPLDEPCGDCRRGSWLCVSGTLECRGAVGRTGETCDGRDNDCDSRCKVTDIDGDGQLEVNCPDVCNGDCDEKIDENPQNEPLPDVGVECFDCSVAQGACNADADWAPLALGMDAIDSIKGLCGAGTSVCVDGAVLCPDAVGPDIEICDALDNDCDDLIDEGIPVGQACGSDVGECVPGREMCDPVSGELMCDGEIGQSDEMCDGFDNDCDGITDEGLGLGDECGTNEGVCMTGQLACQNGESICVDSVAPQPEGCDCQDNDCDGNTDEAPDSDMCPGVAGASCVMCQCAVPCAGTEEFDTRCPLGKSPVDDGNGCFCVGSQCDARDCAMETITAPDGEVQCAPERSDVGACQCKNNECDYACNGVVCEGELVCDRLDGRCKVRSCLLQQFACDDGQRCDPLVMDCVVDECASAGCAGPCREGECFATCANVDCAEGRSCKSGVCEVDLCHERTTGVDPCGANEVCNPADGECVAQGACVGTGCQTGLVCDIVGGECTPDPCLATDCGQGEVCANAECVERCPADDELDCGGVCVRPGTSREFCGATGDCTGGGSGSTCGDGFVCADGACAEDCPDGQIECDGECRIAATDTTYCGASGDCQGDNRGEDCGSTAGCVEGECVSNFGGDGTAGDTEIDGRLKDDEDPFRRALVSGGGGCACAVASGGTHTGSDGSPLALTLGLLGLVWLRLRRRRVVAAAGAGKVRGAAGRAASFLALLALILGGCTVEPYCIDCPDPNAPDGAVRSGAIIGGGGPQGGGATVDGGGDGDSTGGDGDATGDGDSTSGDGDGDGVGGDGDSVNGCQDETCNGLDDDCDGEVDEGTDPAADGIDLDADASNCGVCGNVCQLAHAFSGCSGGVCAVDSCDFSYVDLDGSPDNGCEYRCAKDADEDSLCDSKDNDCDGNTDENVDLLADPNNCGVCNARCSFQHAQVASCVGGKCELSPSDCDPGYLDLDGSAGNGCEYQCTPSDQSDDAFDGVEVCNNRDDDCDGSVDEGVAGTADPELIDAETIGTDCWPGISGVPAAPEEGECSGGTYTCVGGQTRCLQGVGPSDELCDNLDNDCNAQVDDGILGLGVACGEDRGECDPGTRECVAGVMMCVSQVGPAAEVCDGFDNDCDGRTDEQRAGEEMPNVELDCFPDGMGGTIFGQNANLPGLCQSGESVCNLGQVLCPSELEATANSWPRGYIGKQPELCDADDHDCDGSALNGVDQTDQRIGKACGSDQGECTFGTNICSGGVLTCDNSGGQVSVQEICNGLDDDCDGTIDDDQDDGSPPSGAGEDCIIDPQGNVQYGNVSVTGECVLGTSICSNGIVACPDYQGSALEQCNGLDDDCDSSTDESDPLLGQRCDDPGGLYCDPGTYFCDSQTDALGCENTMLKAQELCDGLDNDCDPNTGDGADETWVQTPTACRTLPNGTVLEGGAIPGAAVGECIDGSLACIGGNKLCINETRPAGEACDDLDNDCDSSTDEDYARDSSIYNCGTCGTRCEDVITDPHVILQCTSGTCEIAVCEPTYYPQYPQANYCTIGPCNFNGGEVCNGQDDDCNGMDDDLPGGTAPACLTAGRCTGNSGDATCMGVDGWECATDPIVEACNDFGMGGNTANDDDCDGNIDEGFGVGTPCFADAMGACATQGMRVCNPNYMPGVNDPTVCAGVDGMGDPQYDMSGDPIIVAAGSPQQETCDNADQDCDGDIDEACPDGVSGVDCVSDAWVDIGWGTTQIYQYEASRPDATQSGSGSNERRACSGGGRLPWTDVTYDEAVTACAAADAVLCSEDQWTSACMNDEMGVGYCDYPYPDAGCQDADYSSDRCNGFEYASSPTIQPSGQSGSAGQCYREYDDGDVYELSGNVKELVLKRPNGVIPVKGGAHNNLQYGMRCDFSFPSFPDDESFTNVGFRCCRGNPGGPPILCSTISVSGINQGPPIIGDLTHNLNFGPTGTITSVTVTDLQGTIPNYTNITGMYLRSPDGTEVQLIDGGGYCNGSANWSMAYSDLAGPLHSAVSCSTPTGGGAQYQPAGSLGSLVGEDPSGNWRMRITDNVGAFSTNPALTGWAVEVCYQEP